MPEPQTDNAMPCEAITDTGAFLHLYDTYFPRVYAYTAARVNHQQDAEDLVSEIFMRALKNLYQLRQPQPATFAAWLFTIARNIITDYYRQQGRGESWPLISIEGLSDQGNAPEQQVIAEEASAHLLRLIATLPDRQREIVTLRYYGGLRNNEIAAVLGIGEKTVSGYLSRALTDLQTRLTTPIKHPEKD